MAWSVLMERWTFLQSLILSSMNLFFFSFFFLVFEIPLRFYPTFFHPFTPSLPSSIHFRVFLFVFIKCVVM